MAAVRDVTRADLRKICQGVPGLYEKALPRIEHLSASKKLSLDMHVHEASTPKAVKSIVRLLEKVAKKLEDHPTASMRIANSRKLKRWLSHDLARTRDKQIGRPPTAELRVWRALPILLVFKDICDPVHIRTVLERAIETIMRDERRDGKGPAMSARTAREVASTILKVAESPTVATVVAELMAKARTEVWGTAGRN